MRSRTGGALALRPVCQRPTFVGQERTRSRVCRRLRRRPGPGPRSRSCRLAIPLFAGAAVFAWVSTSVGRCAGRPERQWSDGSIVARRGRAVKMRISGDWPKRRRWCPSRLRGANGRSAASLTEPAVLSVGGGRRLLDGPRFVPGDSIPGNGRHRTGAGLHLGDHASSHRGPDDVMPAVVLSGDAVQALHVDGVGCADGRFQFGAAGNAGWAWFSPPGDWWRYRNCSESTPGLVDPFPRAGIGTAPGPGMNCIGMQWIPMHWIPMQSRPPSIAMDRYGYHWNG